MFIDVCGDVYIFSSIKLESARMRPNKKLLDVEEETLEVVYRQERGYVIRKQKKTTQQQREEWEREGGGNIVFIYNTLVEILPPFFLSLSFTYLTRKKVPCPK